MRHSILAAALAVVAFAPSARAATYSVGTDPVECGVSQTVGFRFGNLTNHPLPAQRASLRGADFVIPALTAFQRGSVSVTFPSAWVCDGSALTLTTLTGGSGSLARTTTRMHVEISTLPPGAIQFVDAKPEFDWLCDGQPHVATIEMTTSYASVQAGFFLSIGVGDVETKSGWTTIYRAPTPYAAPYTSSHCPSVDSVGVAEVDQENAGYQRASAEAFVMEELATGTL